MAPTRPSWRPPDIPDVLVHETAVPWFRQYLRKLPWTRPGNAKAQRQKFKDLAPEFAQHVDA